MFVIITIIPLGIPIIVKCYTMFFFLFQHYVVVIPTHHFFVRFQASVSLTTSEQWSQWQKYVQHTCLVMSEETSCGKNIQQLSCRRWLLPPKWHWVVARCCDRRAMLEKIKDLPGSKKKPSKIKDGNDNFPWFFPLISHHFPMFDVVPTKASVLRGFPNGHRRFSCLGSWETLRNPL